MSTATDMPLSEVMAKAADHIEKVGLLKGSFFDYSIAEHEARAQGPCCTVGAFMVVVDTKYQNNIPIPEIEKALGVDHIPTWNDQYWQRKGKVVSRLRNAAKRLAKEGK